MFRRVAQLILFGLLISVGCATADAAKRVALVIGNNAYENLPVLQKAVNDARSVADTLRDIGFKVHLGENLTRRQTSRKLSNFAADLSPGDQAFVFFAGHGVALGAENYLIPADMPKPRAGEDGLVRDEAIAVSELVARVQRRGAAASFFVLDACRDNPFAATGVRSIGSTRGLTRVTAPSGVFILFSAGIGQTALDRLSDQDPDRNSVFTRKLVPLLKTPGLTHIGLAKTLQREVSVLAGTVPHRQQPAYYDEIIGEIVLRPAEKVAKPPETETQAKPPLSPAAEAWSVIKKTTDPDELEIFIERFPESFFADLAKRRLAKLKTVASAREKNAVGGTRPQASDPNRQIEVVRREDPAKTPASSLQRPKDVKGKTTTSNVHDCDLLAADSYDGNRVSPAIIEFPTGAVQRAIDACRQAIAAHPDVARFRNQLAFALLNKGDASTDAVLALKDAVDHGSTAALLHLGEAYYRGTVIGKDEAKAVEYWRKAAERGDPLGNSFLAYAHAEGISVPKDEAAALSLARKAVRPDIGRYHIPSLIFDKWYEAIPEDIRTTNGHLVETLSEKLLARLGVERGGAELVMAMTYTLLGTSEEISRAWRRRAARAGNSFAVLSVLVTDIKTKNTANEKELGQLLLEASIAGDNLAPFVLGIFYAHGISVGKDGEQSHRFIRDALKRGFAGTILATSGDVLKAQSVHLGYTPEQAEAAVDVLIGFFSDIGKQPGDADLFYGLVIGPDSEEGIRQVEKAAALGNDLAHLVLAANSLDGLVAAALARAEGQAAPDSALKLKRHVEAAAENGNIIAMATMAYLVGEGVGGSADALESRKWADKIIGTGIVDRLLPLLEMSMAQTIAQIFTSELKIEAQQAALEAAGVASVARDVVANLFDPKSGFAGRRLLGLVEGMAKEGSLEWLQTAAIDGDPAAMLLVGLMQSKNPKSASDEALQANKKALAWLRRSAEKGDPFGKLFLGLAYALGVGTDRDTAQAVKWVDEALQQRLGNYLPKLVPAAKHIFGAKAPTPDAKRLMVKLTEGLKDRKGRAELLIGLLALSLDAKDQTLKWLVRAVAEGNQSARKVLEDDSLAAALQ